jgi:hypothetical protein
MYAVAPSRETLCLAALLPGAARERLEVTLKFFVVISDNESELKGRVNYRYITPHYPRLE